VGINMIGNRNYGVNFRAMVPLTQVQPGYYPDAQEATFGNPAFAGLNFGGDGRACSYVTGWFVIDNIVYSNGEVIALDARFEQHCGRPEATRGQIHWRSDDPTEPPGPELPPPAGLWAPDSGAVPASGNVVYLTSDGDFIGVGRTYLYTPLNSVIVQNGGGMTPVGNRFQLTVTGDEEWTGYFQAMNSLPDLRAGYYGNLLGFPSHNPVAGGLAWSGEGRGCNQASGWFVVDNVQYSGNSLAAIELRFEYHCEKGPRWLRGYIRWSASDTRTPPPPGNPPPASLWQPTAGATPASGNYVYLQSQPDEWVGDGETHLYTSADAVFDVTTNGPQFNIDVHGDKHWGGLWRPMVPLPTLVEGYYPLPDGNSIAKGVYDWHGDGRGCNGGSGWYAVDEITFDGSALRSVTLRFERRCPGFTGALRGKVRWQYDDATQPPGPVNPPPTGLWAPAPGDVPATGNFFYVAGDPGDFITGGQTYLFTPADGMLTGGNGVNNSDNYVAIQNGASNLFWDVRFKWMSSIPRLQPGYYPNLQGFPGNPARGTLSLGGQSRGCNTSTGWFVVNSVSYNGDTLTSLDATFVQHCEGHTAAARGRVRWSQ
jgi:hypothetical protein